jgi:phage shock protein E
MPRFFLKIIVTVILGGSMQAMAETVWIDVRGADEYAAGHVPGALLIPHDQIAALIADKVSDKNADIQLYCRSGRRADVARDVMLKMGYASVTNHGSLENALLVAEQSSLTKQE